MPIDFVYAAEQGKFCLDGIDSDADLAARVQQGTTESAIYRNLEGVIRLTDVFGGITPADLIQDLMTGKNNIEKASTAKYKSYL